MKYIHINDKKYSVLITIDYFKRILGGIATTYPETFLKLLLYDAHQYLTISLAHRYRNGYFWMYMKYFITKEI